MFKLAALDTVKVKIYLGTAALTRLKAGDMVNISTETGGSIHQGTISRIADEAEFAPKNVQTAESRADLVYAITIIVPNPDYKLKIGMPVFVAAAVK
jgi:HlyD family secretion protein